MKIACADCGCLVERGTIVAPCAQHPACCCGDLPVADSVPDEPIDRRRQE